MILHFAIIAIQCAALAAFLILWYFWVKKRIESSYCMEDEDQVLFPFRYFSWILMGLVVITVVAQIHFVRVSSQVHERVASMTKFYEKQQKHTATLEELKGMMTRLRSDMDSNFRGLRAQIPERIAQAQPADTTTDPRPVAPVAPSPRQALVRLEPQHSGPSRGGFAREARASSAAGVVASLPHPSADQPTEKDDKDYSMRLQREGRVLTDRLRVRKRPQSEAPVVERLMSGQKVKVTEKRLLKDGLWFRVITPSGRAGWVDYRYVKLAGSV